MKRKIAAVILTAMMFTSCSSQQEVSQSGDISENSSQPESSVEVSTGGESSSEATSDGESSAPQTPDKNEIITASEMAKLMGMGISLGNTMEAYNAQDCEKITYEWIPTVGENSPTDYETCWGADVTTQEIISGMKAEGFNTVRIPVFWGNMMENDDTYTINDQYIARVKEIVDYCENAGVYCVINIHHFDEFIIRRNDLEKCKEIFSHLWTQIAEYFKDYPYTVVFEGYNEYLGGSQFDGSGQLKEQSESDAYKMTNELNQVFVDAVRATGGKNNQRVLIVSGYWTNIDLTSSSLFIMPTDTVNDRLMVSVHYVDNSMYWTNKIGGQEWLDYRDSQCELLEKAFTRKGIPVFMGETTASYPRDRFAPDAIYTDSSQCLEIVLSKLVEHGFVPVIWDTNSNFYSRTTYRINSDSDRQVIKEAAEKIAEN